MHEPPTTVDGWIRYLHKLKSDEDRLTVQLAVAKKVRNEQQLLAAEFWAQEGITSAKTEDGVRGYVRHDTYVSQRCDSGVLCAALRACGFGDLVKESVHPSTLKAQIKEFIARHREDAPGCDPIECLPEAIRPIVAVHEESRVIVVGAGSDAAEAASGMSNGVTLHE